MKTQKRRSRKKKTRKIKGLTRCPGCMKNGKDVRLALETKNLIKSIKKSPIHSLLTVGRVEENKGFDRMYEVFKKLRVLDPRWRWNIVGEGSYLNSFRIKVESDNLSDAIKFTGKVNYENLPDLYKKSSVFMLLSECLEALGLVYLEALSCCIPVVTYDRYGPSEIVSSVKGCSGVSFSCTDAEISEVIDNLNSHQDNDFGKGLELFSSENFLTEIKMVIS